jgi:hypothetical protein
LLIQLSNFPVAALRLPVAAFGLLFPQHGLQHYFKTHYADRTFEHLYHWNSFDTALLIPYFVVMVFSPSMASIATSWFTATTSTARMLRGARVALRGASQHHHAAPHLQRAIRG